MRILLLAATLAGVALPAGAAQANHDRYYGGGYHDRGYRDDVRDELRECRRELRHADSRREYRRELRECRRELRQARRDHRRDYRRYDRHDDDYGYYGRGQRYWDGYRWRYRW